MTDWSAPGSTAYAVKGGGAAVVEHADLAVVIANHDRRISAYVAGCVVARFGNFGFVADKYSGSGEYPFHLKVK